jgi:hypothetical protein
MFTPLRAALGTPSLLAVVMLGFKPGADIEDTKVVTGNYGATENPDATALVKLVVTPNVTLLVTNAPIDSSLVAAFTDGINENGQAVYADGRHASYTFADGGKGERDGYIVINGTTIELKSPEIGNRANYQLLETDSGPTLIARNGKGEGYRFNFGEKAWTRDETIDGPADALLTLPGENNKAYMFEGSSDGLKINGVATAELANKNVTRIVANPTNFDEAMVVADNTPYLLQREGETWKVLTAEGPSIVQYASVLWGRDGFAGINYDESTVNAEAFQLTAAIETPEA